MNTLVAVGTGSAYLYSTIVTFLPHLIGIEGHTSHFEIYYDTTAVIITLILFGRWLEAKSKSKTSSAIKKLIGLKPKTAIFLKMEKKSQLKLMN